MADFLHRPPGTDALPTAGSVARPEHAVRAVLRTADGGVLVASIAHRPDGSFSGEVYGVTPRERQVAVGDRVTFGESQIFSYKASGAEGPSRDEVERAEMIRAFGEAFRDVAAPNPERAAADDGAPADFAFEPEAPAAPPVEPRVPTAEPEITVDDAYAILGGAKPFEEDVREPVREKAPEAVVPPSVVEKAAPVVEARIPVADEPSPIVETPAPVVERPAPLPEPPPTVEAAPVAREPVACLECGATLVLPAGEEPLKVSCGSCGRINDVAQARAAMQRRRQMRDASRSG